MLSEKQFKLLRFLLIHKDENFTQRQLAEQLDLSLGTVNALVGKLKEEKWIDEEHHLNELGKKRFRTLSSRKCYYNGCWNE